MEETTARFYMDDVIPSILAIFRTLFRWLDNVYLFRQFSMLDLWLAVGIFAILFSVIFGLIGLGGRQAGDIVSSGSSGFLHIIQRRKDKK